MMKVKIVNEVKRSDGSWRFACGDVLSLSLFVVWFFVFWPFCLLCLHHSYQISQRVSNLKSHPILKWQWPPPREIQENSGFLEEFFSSSNYGYIVCGYIKHPSLLRVPAHLWHCVDRGLLLAVAQPCTAQQSKLHRPNHSVNHRWHCWGDALCQGGRGIFHLRWRYWITSGVTSDDAWGWRPFLCSGGSAQLELDVVGRRHQLYLPGWPFTGAGSFKISLVSLVQGAHH